MLPASQLVSRALSGDRTSRAIMGAMIVANALAFAIAEVMPGS
jgi:hypothetical protein